MENDAARFILKVFGYILKAFEGIFGISFGRIEEKEKNNTLNKKN